MPSFEVLLPLGAIGLYLFDSVLALYGNELLFVRADGHWRLGGERGWVLFGRRLVLLDPLHPASGAFPIRWFEDDARTAPDAADLERFFRALRPLRYAVMSLLTLLAALPFVLVWFGTGTELLVFIAMFYAVIFAALGYVGARRRALQLNGRAVAALAFDCLACAPFAVNLLRKVVMRRSLGGNPLLFAETNFDPDTWRRLIDYVRARVEDEQLREPPGSIRWSRLQGFREELLRKAPPQPAGA